MAAVSVVAAPQGYMDHANAATGTVWTGQIHYHSFFGSGSESTGSDQADITVPASQRLSIDYSNLVEVTAPYDCSAPYALFDTGLPTREDWHLSGSTDAIGQPLKGFSVVPEGNNTFRIVNPNFWAYEDMSGISCTHDAEGNPVPGPNFSQAGIQSFIGLGYSIGVLTPDADGHLRGEVSCTGGPDVSVTSGACSETVDLAPSTCTASTDSDGDGLSDCDETTYGTNPHNPDTDGDGWSDGAEVAAGTNPLDPTSHPIGPPPPTQSVTISVHLPPGIRESEQVTFGGTPAGTVGDGGSLSSPAQIGTVTSTWEPSFAEPLTLTMSAVSCSDSDSTGDTRTQVITFRVSAREHITCDVTFAARDQPPVATDVHQTANTFPATGQHPIAVDFRQQATDPDGDFLAVTNLTPVQNTDGWTVNSISWDNTQLTPPAGFAGTAAWSYTVRDPQGLTATAMLWIQVTALRTVDLQVNDDSGALTGPFFTQPASVSASDPPAMLLAGTPDTHEHDSIFNLEMKFVPGPISFSQHTSVETELGFNYISGVEKQENCVDLSPLALLKIAGHTSHGARHSKKIRRLVDKLARKAAEWRFGKGKDVRVSRARFREFIKGMVDKAYDVIDKVTDVDVYCTDDIRDSWDINVAPDGLTKLSWSIPIHGYVPDAVSVDVGGAKVDSITIKPEHGQLNAITGAITCDLVNPCHAVHEVN